MRCPHCGSENRVGAKFCDECAAPLPLACPSCGAENRAGAKFCNECATPLSQQLQPPVQRSTFNVQRDGHLTPDPPPPVSYTPKHLAERILAEQAALEARGAPNGERKTITALFADIKGSTALIEDLDPEEARAIIDPALKIMMDAVHRYEGYVAQALGDGIFALFGAPIAHEDHVHRALYAALLMQEESRKQAEQLRREKGVNVQIRIGVNTGEVVPRSIRKDDLHTDYVPVGHSTNIASRMESLATPGSIVISDATYKLTAGYFEHKALGAAQVKGVSEPLQIYEVLGVGPLRTRLQVAARRGLARFVGRQSEMDALLKALEQAKLGHGQIAGVMGEPGVGKSRLFHEFKLLYQHGCLVLETFSVSHGKAYPYLPLIDLLKNYFQLTAQDDESKRREKLTGKVLTLDRGLEDTLPYLFHLLGIAEPDSPLLQMDPQIRRKRTLEAIKRILIRESLKQPLILVFEDLHWLDNETQAFLSLLSESVASARMLLLVNYRPEYRHEWGSKTYYTQLRLDPLGRAEAEEMLTALLAEKFPPRPAGARSIEDFLSLKTFILDKTEGNPFFMEEIVQELVERGASSLTDLHIPPTVQTVLTSRIDRLPLEEKDLLQTLAVIGKEFPFSLLKQVVGHSEDILQQQLSHLREAEFIYEQPAFPEPNYVFKHALTQEVAYNSMLIERRKVLHERAAQAIESLFHSRLDDQYSELASHYSRSGNTQKAVDYLQLAGQQAVQRSANAEAITHLTAALELLKSLPETPERDRQELTLQLALGTPLVFTKGFSSPEVHATYARARELCQKVGEVRQIFPTLYGLRTVHQVGGEFPVARELGEQLLSLAQQEQDASLLVEAHWALGYTLCHLGELREAQAHLQQGFALYDAQQHHSPAFPSGRVAEFTGLFFASRVLWPLGYPAQALQRSEAECSLAQELAHTFTLTSALVLTAMTHQHRRDRLLTQERAAAGIALAREQGFPVYVGQGSVLHGWALANRGQIEEGLSLIRQGLVTHQATGAGIFHSYFLGLQAEVYGKAGRAEEGLATLVEAFAFVKKSEERFYEPELHRLKGELTLQQENQKAKIKRQKSKMETRPQHLISSTQEAEECFLKALEVSRQQQAKSLELRAAMSLARLWQSQGKRNEARQVLSDIYNWFTEGFDTKDLQEAKVLLEELEQPKRKKQTKPKAL